MASSCTGLYQNLKTEGIFFLNFHPVEDDRVRRFYHHFSEIVWNSTCACQEYPGALNMFMVMMEIAFEETKPLELPLPSWVQIYFHILPEL